MKCENHQKLALTTVAEISNCENRTSLVSLEMLNQLFVFGSAFYFSCLVACVVFHYIVWHLLTDLLFIINSTLYVLMHIFLYPEWWP